jgi:hypothetical protein
VEEGDGDRSLAEMLEGFEAIGAPTGAMIGGMRRRDQMRQQDAQQAQQMQALQMDTFSRAQATCLQECGYPVN